MYGFLINLFHASFITITLSLLMGMQMLSMRSTAQIIQSSIVVFLVTFNIVMMISLVGYLVSSPDRMKDEGVQAKIGSFYSDINQDRGRIALTWSTFFLVRRLLLSFSLVLTAGNFVL